MAKLKDIHRVFIIKLLARFYRPSEIRDEIKEKYKMEVGIKQICEYDPRGFRGDRVAKKWCEIFDIERSRFLAESNSEEIDIFNRNFRLREMSKNYKKMVDAGNIIAAQQILEQAAKEAGNLYVNRYLLGPDDSEEQRKLLDESRTIMNFFAIRQPDSVDENDITRKLEETGGA